MLNNYKMQEEIIAWLEESLSPRLHYHNIHHTLYVQQIAMHVGRVMECSPQELRLLHAAALWHDTGFIIRRKGHEEESVKLAKEQLPRFQFKPEEIDAVCIMIMGTKLPQKPEGHLAEILADADLEYLGTEEAEAKADLLFKELKAHEPELTRSHWNKQQVAFLKDHSYFTAYCREHKQPRKEKYLQSLLLID